MTERPQLERLNEATVRALATLASRQVGNVQRILDAITVEWRAEAAKVLARVDRGLDAVPNQTEFVSEPESPAMTEQERDAADEVYGRRQDA